MLGRMVFVLMLCVAVALVPAVSFAGGGVAVAVPSCNNCVNGNVQLQVRSYAPAVLAVPVQAQYDVVELRQLQVEQRNVKIVKNVQAVAVPVELKVKHVGNRNQGNFRTPVRNAVQAFRQSFR